MEKKRLDALLEELRMRSGCEYLSDLAQVDYRDSVGYAVGAMEASAYPKEIWIQALQYITGQSEEVSTAGEAKARLSERLKRRRG